MSVPDWPNTYGYNMFLFPLSRWVGGIFFEHSHRLIASVVGLATGVLALVLWVRGSKTVGRWIGIGVILAILATVIVLTILVHTAAIYVGLAFVALVAMIILLACYVRTGELRWAGLVGLTAVILQGFLGGLRVVLHMDWIGIFHALLAQSFFVGLVLLAVVTGRAFVEKRWVHYAPHRSLRWVVLATTLLIFLQLGIAATMRHEHAGLSIPDFPLAYGSLLPDTSPQAVAAINAQRVAAGQPATTAVQIWIQMAHRGVALLIAAGVGIAAWQARHAARPLRGWAYTWLGMILVQIGMGAWTIWSDKAADIATGHMALGALSLVVGAVLSLRLFLGARTQDFAWPDAPKRPFMTVA